MEFIWSEELHNTSLCFHIEKNILFDKTRPNNEWLNFTLRYFAWSDETLTLHCQTRTSSYCLLMVLALLMLTSSSTAHCVRFTVWFPSCLADTLRPAQRNSGIIWGVWQRGKTSHRGCKLVRFSSQNILCLMVMLKSQLFKSRIWFLIRTKRRLYPC